MDSALQLFSLKYLKIIEKTLKVENADIGKPTLYYGRINTITLQILKNQLNDLIKSSELEKATNELYNLTNDKKKKIIVSTGVGFSDEFSNFVKLGFLIGDKVILWDSILIGLLNHKTVINFKVLEFIVTNILSTKGLAEKGAIYFLPHPSIWNDEAKFYFNTISKTNNLNNTFLGMANALILNKTGVKCFPYLMNNDISSAKNIQKSLFDEKNPYFNIDKLNFHFALNKLMKFKEFPFLQELDLLDFYDILTKKNRFEEFKQELFIKLNFSDKITEIEKEKKIVNSLNILAKDFDKYSEIVSKDFRNALINTTIGSVTTIFSGLGIYYGDTTSQQLISSIALLGTTYLTFETLIKSLGPIENPVFYQIFSEMKFKYDEKKKM